MESCKADAVLKAGLVAAALTASTVKAELALDLSNLRAAGIQPLAVPLQALAHRQLQPTIQPRQMLTLLSQAFAGMAQPSTQMIEPLGLGVEAPAPGRQRHGETPQAPLGCRQSH